jgi:peptidoglycan/LPS O-acetylase OafA/YrhL
VQSTLIQQAEPGTGTSQDAAEPSNSFTLLRLLLASMVIVAHAAELSDGNRSREIFHRLGAQISAGDFAVEAFFVVSGCLILESWSRQPKFSAYLMKRILRIVPAFLAAYLISVFLVGWLGGGPAYFAELFRPSGLLQLLPGLVLLTYPHTPPVFAGFPYPMVNGALWTITYEFRCYLLIPVLAALGLYSRRLLFATGWLAVVLGAGWYSATHLQDAMSPGLLHFAPFFLAGNCAYLYRDRIRWNRTLGGVSMVAAVLSMGSLAASMFVLPIAGSYAILWLALSKWSPLCHFSPTSDISYGVYLYGWPTQKLLLWYFPSLPLGLQMLATLGISMLLGWASWNLIEKRCLAFKARFAHWNGRAQIQTPAGRAESPLLGLLGAQPKAPL